MSTDFLKPPGFACAGLSRMRRRAVTYAALAMTMVTLLSIPALASSIQATISTQQAPIYENAYGNGEPFTQLPFGEEVRVERWNEDGYSQVTIGSDTGYVKSSHLKRLSIAEKYSPSKRGRTNADGVNLRTRYDLGASIIAVLKKNVAVEVLGRSDNWYKINLNGTIGYVNVEYVDIVNASSADTSVTTLRMGMSGKEVARMQQALSDSGYYKGKINGNFGARTRDAVKAFQHDHKLAEDGVADPATLSLLYA